MADPSGFLLQEYTIEDFRSLMNTNLESAFSLSQVGWQLADRPVCLVTNQQLC